MNLVEVVSCLVKNILSLSETWKQSTLYFTRNLLVWVEKWIFIW